jgi:hypothetical protein
MSTAAKKEVPGISGSHIAIPKAILLVSPTDGLDPLNSIIALPFSLGVFVDFPFLPLGL